MMEIQFAKWGNSVAVRVPSKVAEALAIVPGSVAVLEVKQNQLVITPRRSAYRLEELLAGITKSNVHQAVASGAAVGAEAID